MTSHRHLLLQSILYDPEAPRLRVLDQLLLPTRAEYIEVTNSREGWDTIRTMKVRGAPLIAIVAMLSLAVEVKEVLSGRLEELMAEDAVQWLIERLELLKSSRPTAVNLFTACDSAEELGKNKKRRTYGGYCFVPISCFVTLMDDCYELNREVEKGVIMCGEERLLGLINWVGR